MRRLSEGGVYKRAAFISKIKITENEIMCQFKTKYGKSSNGAGTKMPIKP